MTSWDTHYIGMAELVSKRSKDTSTKVGAVIVGPDNEVRSTGYNGFPRHVDDSIPSRFDRPSKYLYTEHAERNAIYNAARVGVPLKGCRIYLNWEPCPCTDCTRAIIQSGIVEVLGPDRPYKGRGEGWKKDLSVSEGMMEEASIKTTIIKEKTIGSN